MSDFFEPPPPRPPESAPPDPPPWVAPPRGVLPGVLAAERVVVRSDRVAICLVRFSVYPTGFEFDVLVIAADEEEELDPFVHRHPGHWKTGQAPEIPAEMLRLGVEFADGSKATNTAGRHAGGDQPEAPVMHERGGSGGGGSWRQTQWVWPLPPDGPLALVCEWPSMDIPLTRTEIDADALCGAASHAQAVFGQ